MWIETFSNFLNFKLTYSNFTTMLESTKMATVKVRSHRMHCATRHATRRTALHCTAPQHIRCERTFRPTPTRSCPGAKTR